MPPPPPPDSLYQFVENFELDKLTSGGGHACVAMTVYTHCHYRTLETAEAMIIKNKYDEMVGLIHR